MDIGIGLPAAVPGTPAATIVEWARRAEHAGFSTLATTDRTVYDSYEPLTTLAAAAAVTERIRLMTAILISPLHTNPALLTKQVATVDRLSGHRLVLGLAVGSRPDDFGVSKVPMAGRGARLETQLDDLTRLWEGEPGGIALGAGPAPGRTWSAQGGEGGPPVILGGHTPATLDRAARRGAGWIAGGAGPEAFAHGAGAVRAGWARHGRAGTPRMFSLVYFALGDGADQVAGDYLRAYYRSAGPFAEMTVRQAVVDVEGAAAAVRDFEAAGCDELIFVPCSAALSQVDRLAAAVFQIPARIA